MKTSASEESPTAEPEPPHTETLSNARARKLCDLWAVYLTDRETHIGPHGSKVQRFEKDAMTHDDQPVTGIDPVFRAYLDVELALCKVFAGRLNQAGRVVLFQRHHERIEPKQLLRMDLVARRRMLELAFGSGEAALEMVYEALECE